MKSLSVDKIVKSGHFLEVISYKQPRGSSLSKTSPKSTASQDLFDSRLSSVYRAKRQLKRLIYANHGFYKERTRLLTLTFKDNIGVDEGYRRVNIFFKQLNRHLGITLQYVCVAEIQKKRQSKEGGEPVHFHILLFNFPYLNKVYVHLHRYYKDRLDLVTVPISAKDVAGCFKYLEKYIGKDFEGTGFRRKRFSSTHSLRKPLVCRDQSAIFVLLPLLKGYEVYKTSLSLPFIGSVDVTHYYVPRGINPDYLPSFVNASFLPLTPPAKTPMGLSSSFLRRDEENLSKQMKLPEV